MELCSTCKKEKCNKRIVIIEQDNLKIIKCLEYEKDINKIQGYTQPLWITAHKSKAFMDLNI
ncbi:MAG: hypothetical protein ACI4UX_01240 [Clostridia bacterium]